MQRVTTHLWFDTEAAEAAEFYAAVFPDSEVISINDFGGVEVVSFRVCGRDIEGISAGPMFQKNPSISFLVACKTVEDVDGYWDQLADGGNPLMPVGEYDFSKRYGWIEDRYGVSWQLYFTEDDLPASMMPSLMFTKKNYGKAEEAAQFYSSIFENSSLQVLDRYGKGEGPEQPGCIKYAHLILDGQAFGIAESALAETFEFNEAVSLIISCRDQEEIDYYWDSLSAVPEAERCGWIKDKYGVSWQVVPSNMASLIALNPKKTVPIMLEMKKIVITDLEKAGQE